MESLSYSQRIGTLIAQVNDDVLRNNLQHEIRKLIEDQQNLVSMIHNQAQTFKIEAEEMKDIIHDSQRRYEKAVREMQFYKKKYDKLIESLHHQSSDYSERVTPWIEDRRRFRDSSSASLHSSISSSTNESQTYDDRKPPSFSRNPSIVSGYSTPSSVAASSTTGTTRVSISAVTTTGSLKIQQQKTDPLIFGGSEAFWETISKSQGDDSTVEKIISNFLRRGGSPNTAMQQPSQNAVKYGYGMIHALIVTKSPASLDLLLQQGANPNAMSMSQLDEDRVSPCYLAARIGWFEGLQRLVQAGGDLMSARGHGKKKKTALHVAAEMGHASIVNFIIAMTEGVLNMEIDSTGANALHYACLSGHRDLVAYILRVCQIPVSKPDNRGEVPLHWATRSGSLEIVALLVEKHGSDVNSFVYKKVNTPYDLAKLSGHKKVADYIKNRGGLSTKKMEKKQEEEMTRKVPQQLESRLAMNGMF